MGNKLFGFELKYQNPDTSKSTPTAKYNGNISQINWSTSTDVGVIRTYTYQYDALNRLTGSKLWDQVNNDRGEYHENLTFDINGNIKSLYRTGKQMSGFTAPEKMEDLEYYYKNNNNSNRLTYLKEKLNGGNAISGYPLSSGQQGQTITYDYNGNMITQVDKGISAIVYNFLNLPTQVVQNGVTTQYVYRADRTKLKKSYGTGKVTDYLDGFQYETVNSITTLQFVPTAEGYYDFTKNLYIYNYNDHLGNVRLSYADSNKNGAIEASTEIIEENNYYPFGLKHEGYNSLAGNQSYQYKYNGKELQETGMYDYGARFYMPDIGRWGVVDPLAEKFPGWSPYNYAMNNPVIYIDPDGRETKSIHLDNKGNVLRNINDGDNSVFVHKKGTKGSDIDKKYTNSNHSAGGQKIGELGKTLNVNGIYTNLLTDNIKEAKGIYNPFTFKSLVTDGGDWDLKVQKNTIWGLANDGQTQFSFGGKLMESQDIGNHHFGAVALAALGYLLSEKEILMQAGDNQIGNGRSKPEWQPTKTIMRTEVLEHGIKVTRPEKIRLPPYGDDPRDYNWINSGFRYYKTH